MTWNVLADGLADDGFLVPYVLSDMAADATPFIDLVSEVVSARDSGSEEAMAAIRLYQPDVLILTLGFDIYKNDPQAKDSATSEGFCRLSTHLRQLGLPTLVVQEGGYDLDALSENVQQFFKGLEG